MSPRVMLSPRAGDNLPETAASVGESFFSAAPRAIRRKSMVVIVPATNTGVRRTEASSTPVCGRASGPGASPRF